MWWLILAGLWAPPIGAACTVIWWPRIRAWLGAPPPEMDEQDWVELAAAMGRHPAGKGEPMTTTGVAWTTYPEVPGEEWDRRHLIIHNPQEALPDL